MERYPVLQKYEIKVLPYTYFIGLAAFWFLGDLLAIQNFSFVALGIIVALAIQIVWQNKVVGTCLGVLATAVSFLAFLATLSEFNDFAAVTQSAIHLLAVGATLSLCGLAMGVVLTVTNMRRLAI